MANYDANIYLNVYAKLYFKSNTASEYYSSYIRTANPIETMPMKTVKPGQSVAWSIPYKYVKDITDSQIGGSSSGQFKTSGNNCKVYSGYVSSDPEPIYITLTLNPDGGIVNTINPVKLTGSQKKKQLKTILALNSQLDFKSGATKDSSGGSYDRSSGVGLSKEGEYYKITFTPTEAKRYDIYVTLFQQSSTKYGDPENDGDPSYPNYTFPTATKEKYTLNHWRAYSNEPRDKWVGVLPNGTIKIERSNTALAIYNRDNEDLSIDPNGGKFSDNSTEIKLFNYKVNNYTTEIGRLNKPGYDIKGFSLNGDLPNDSNFSSNQSGVWSFINSGISGLYKAIWKPNTYAITYKLNYKKPIPGTYNTIDTPVKFFNGNSPFPYDTIWIYPYGEYKPDGSLSSNQRIWGLDAIFLGDTLKKWLTGYEYTLNTSGGLNYNNAADSGSWKKGIVTSGTSTIGQYGDLTLTLDVIPKSYEITYIEGSPRLSDMSLIKDWFEYGVEIVLEPEENLPKIYTIIDESKELYNIRLLQEDKSVSTFTEGNNEKLKLGLDRGLYYIGNLKSNDNNSYSKLTETNPGIDGQYQDYGKLYFTQEYKLSSFIFRFNYKYSSDNYTYIDSKLFYFMGELTNPFSNITLTPGASNNFTFDGWVDSVGVKVIDKDGNITNSGNKELKYFWGKKNSNNQYTYYLIAEKNEDPNNPRIIDLYPKWVRQSGVKVFDGKEWQYPTENGNTNIDNIKINDVDWNNIKEMKVYDGTDWKPVNLNHRPPDPDENIYEEI